MSTRCSLKLLVVLISSMATPSDLINFDLLTVLLRWVYTVSVFRPFLSVVLRFYFSVKKYAIFQLHFYVSISALTRLSHIEQKFSENFFL